MPNKPGPKSGPGRFIISIENGTTPLEIEALLWFIGTSGETKERKQRIVMLYQLWLEDQQRHYQRVSGE